MLDNGICARECKGGFRSARGANGRNRPSPHRILARYNELLKENLAAPMKVELFVSGPDGKLCKQITNNNCAEFRAWRQTHRFLIEHAPVRWPRFRTLHH